MPHADSQVSTVDPDTRIKTEPAADSIDRTNDDRSQTEHTQQTSLQEDANPRSPKRRRLSPTNGDVEIDFEAAAARALAISLGVDQASNNPTPAVSQANPNGTNPTPSLPSSENLLLPDQQSRIENLPGLDDLATQILATLAKMSHLEIGEMLFGPPSQRGQDYRALKARFEQAKRNYLTNSPFVLPTTLGLRQPDHIDTLRKTNMATFMASIFSGEIGLRIMDINFLDVFVPEGGRLLKAQASIYLELKTQAFIAAKRTAPAILEQAMLDLFPTDVEKYLVSKRPGAKSLAPSELDFLKRLSSRRDILYADMRNKRLDNLELRYRWDDFSREVNNYLAKTYDQSAMGIKDKVEQASPNLARTQLQQGQMEGQFPVASSQGEKVITSPPTSAKETGVEFNMDDFMAQAARAAEIAMQGEVHTGYAPAQPTNQISSQSPIPAPVPPPLIAALVVTETPKQSSPQRTLTPAQEDGQKSGPSLQADFQLYQPAITQKEEATSRALSADNGVEVPHRSQTAPTQVLYERARMVTTNKVSPSSRRPNPPSHRRPWTNEEENALMTGLDQVKGPHWSQILAMYGPGGTLNESLKDRNQVQLKDKARNLKLFFLKAGIEVPYYLQAVTGDLKTRAPAQAERREAKERERINTEDDDGLAQQEESQVDIADELDPPTQSLTDQEDVSDPTPATYQAASEQQGASNNDIEGDQNGVLDVEAMIARAAASATQSLDDPWS